MRLQEKAFDIGRAIGKHRIASRLFCMAESVLPLQRVARSHRVVAFWHPRPTYDPHILVVPTTPFPALATPALPEEQKATLLWEMLELADSVAGSDRAKWQMIINGGERQDIGQVHGHLIHAGNDSPDQAWTLGDPRTQTEGWDWLFDHVNRAGNIPGNGYSVTFYFRPGGGMQASFTESTRS